MPVKRRLPKGRPHAVTAEAVAAYSAGDWSALQRALKLPPWACNPLDADRPDHPSWMTNPEVTRWSEAWELRRELEAELSKQR